MNYIFYDGPFDFPEPEEEPPPSTWPMAPAPVTFARKRGEPVSKSITLWCSACERQGTRAKDDCVFCATCGVWL